VSAAPDGGGDDHVAVLLGLTRGYVVTQSLYAAALLGLADHLKDGPRNVTDLAELTGCDAQALHRLLRALASLGIVGRPHPDRFALAPLGQLLRSDVEGSLRSWVLLNGGTLYRTFADISHTLRSGRPSTEVAFGQDLFSHLEATPEEAAVFESAMADISRRWVPATLAVCDVSSARHVVDVGGGSGELLAALLRAHPTVRGTLFDRSHVLGRAREQDTFEGLGTRCELVPGDFFEFVPAGGDTYLLSWILHDWDDEPALRILRNIRAAIVPGGQLLLVESVLPPGDEPHFSRFGDIVMLVALGGRERTEVEYRDLLRGAGFRLERVLPTGGPRSVLEARPC
jgi:SAM-dependent methyltransferase